MNRTVLSLFLAAIILKFLDVATTYVAVNLYGIGTEANPVVRAGMETIGLVPCLFLNWAFLCLVVLWGIHRIPIHKWLVPVIACAIYVPVVINNVYQLTK